MELLKNILKDIVTFGKNFSKMSISGQVAAGIVLIFALYQFMSCQSSNSVDNIKIAAQQTNQQVKQINDSLKILHDSIQQKEVLINKLTIEISLRSKARTKLQSQQQRLEILRDTLIDTVKIIAVQDTTIDNLKTQLAITDTLLIKKDTVIAQKDTVINLLKTSLVLSESKADTLQKTLNYALQQSRKKDKLLGFIPLPSRKVVGITAAVGGIYLGTQIAK